MSTIDTTVVKDTDTITLRNFTTNTVVYRTPSTRVRRELPAGGSIKVTAGEIREMMYDKGCVDILRNYVQICNKPLALEVGVSEDSYENEYNWTLADIKNCLLNGSIEQLADAMDFAPDGIKESLLTEAINLEIPDVRKRDIISKAMNRDVSGMIINKHKIEEDKEPAEKHKTATRRAATTTKRRTTTKAQA